MFCRSDVDHVSSAGPTSSVPHDNNNAATACYRSWSLDSDATTRADDDDDVVDSQPPRSGQDVVGWRAEEGCGVFELLPVGRAACSAAIPTDGVQRSVHVTVRERDADNSVTSRLSHRFHHLASLPDSSRDVCTQVGLSQLVYF